MGLPHALPAHAHSHSLTATRKRRTCIRLGWSPEVPLPIAALSAPAPTAPFWGNKHICQPKNHHEFAFSMAGFRRGGPANSGNDSCSWVSGWQGTGRETGVGRGSSSRAWRPRPTQPARAHYSFPGAGGQVRAGGGEGPAQGPSGVPGCRRTAWPTAGSTPGRQAPGALNSEPQFAHLYNGNTPGRTGAGLGQHCCQPNSLNLAACGKVPQRHMSLQDRPPPPRWVEQAQLLALGWEDTRATLSHWAKWSTHSFAPHRGPLDLAQGPGEGPASLPIPQQSPLPGLAGAGFQISCSQVPMRTAPVTAEAGPGAAAPLAHHTSGLVPAPALDSELRGGGASGGQWAREGPCLVYSYSTCHEGVRCQFPEQISSRAGALGCSPCLSYFLRDAAGER